MVFPQTSSPASRTLHSRSMAIMSTQLEPNHFFIQLRTSFIPSPFRSYMQCKYEADILLDCPAD